MNTSAGNQPDFELPGDLGPKDPRRMEHPVGNIPGAGGHEVKLGSAEAKGVAPGAGNAAPDERAYGETNRETHHTSGAMDPSVDASTSRNVDSRQERQLMGEDIDPRSSGRDFDNVGYNPSGHHHSHGSSGRDTSSNYGSSGLDATSGYGSSGIDSGARASGHGLSSGTTRVGGYSPHHSDDAPNPGHAPGEHTTLAGALLDPEASGTSVLGHAVAQYSGTEGTSSGLGSTRHQSGLTGGEYGSRDNTSSGLGGMGSGSTGSGLGGLASSLTGHGNSGHSSSQSGLTGGEYGSRDNTSSSLGGMGSGSTGSGSGSGLGGLASSLGLGSSGHSTSGHSTSQSGLTGGEYGSRDNTSSGLGGMGSGSTGSGLTGGQYGSRDNTSSGLGSGNNTSESGDKSWTQSIKDAVTGNSSTSGTSGSEYGNTGNNSRSQY